MCTTVLWIPSEIRKKPSWSMTANLRTSSGSMRSAYSNISISRKRRTSFSSPSTRLSTSCSRKLACVTLSLRRNWRPFRSLWKQRTHRLISYLPLQRSTRRHLVLSRILWKRSRTLRTRQSRRFRTSWRRFARLTQTWSRLTKVSSQSLVSLSRSSASTPWFQLIYDI